MAHHAPAERSHAEDPSSGASVPEQRALPPQVAAARDQLFADADQHGPRAGELLRRAAGAVLLLPVALALAAFGPWRSLLIDVFPDGAADALLLTPVLVALVALAALLAPLARMRMMPLLLVSLPLIGLSVLLVAQGSVVLASVPAALGATVFGLVAARAMQRAVWALPVLLAAGISDTQSVRGGVTESLLDDAGIGAAASSAHVDAALRITPELIAGIDFAVLHIPVATGTWMLGLVDVVALGLLLGLSHLYWLPIRRTAIALGAALVLTHLIAAPIAVLPMLGVAWVLANPRLVWRSTRFSVRRLMYLGG